MKQGERRTLNRIASGRVRFHVIHGKKPGPTAVLTAGIHGTETAGVYAAQHLVRNLRIDQGTFIIFPIVNVPAFQKRTRGKPDLNRTFPRRANERAKHPTSEHVFKVAKSHKPSWCIDLHEADGLHRQDPSKLGQTLIVYPDKRTRHVAERVANAVNGTVSQPLKKFDVCQSVLPGSFRTSAGGLLGCHAITVETSIQQPWARRVEYQLKIVHELLQRIGLISSL